MRRIDGVYKRTSPTYRVRIRVIRPARFLVARTGAILAVMIIAGLNTTGLGAVGSTLAYYLDVEISTGNVFAATSLDMTLTAGPYNRPWNQAAFPPGFEVARTLTSSSTGALPFQYEVKTNNFGGDADFCAVLAMDLQHRPPVDYPPLTTFTLPATSTLAATTYEWTWPVISGYENKRCTFDVVYNAWRTDIPSYSTVGFDDTELISHRLDSWGLRLNRVYYDVALGYGMEPDNEWVEIYNQTNQALDLNGWYICDNTSCDTVSATTEIPSHKTAFVSGSTTNAGIWHIPPSTPKVVFADGAIGSGLENDADTVLLKRPDGFIVDHVNWGAPDTGWANYNADLWNPGATTTPEGTYLKRSPSGYDTNQPSDWRISDSDIPQPPQSDDESADNNEVENFSSSLEFDVPQEPDITENATTTEPLKNATTTEPTDNATTTEPFDNATTTEPLVPPVLPSVEPLIIESIDKKEEELVAPKEDAKEDEDAKKIESDEPPSDIVVEPILEPIDPTIPVIELDQAGEVVPPPSDIPTITIE